MICSQCGEENLEGSSFCKKCKKNFKEETKPIEIPSRQELDTNKEQTSSNVTLVTEDKNQTNKKEPANNETDKNPNTDDSLTVFCQCGQKLEAGWNFCPKCKTTITVDIKTANNVEQNTKQENSAIIYIAIYIISIASYMFFRFSYGGLIALIAIIAGKIYCPKSKPIKVIFWVTIYLTILHTIYIMGIMLVCGSTIESCPR